MIKPAPTIEEPFTYSSSEQSEVRTTGKYGILWNTHHSSTCRYVAKNHRASCHRPQYPEMLNTIHRTTNTLSFVCKRLEGSISSSLLRISGYDVVVDMWVCLVLSTCAHLQPPLPPENICQLNSPLDVDGCRSHQVWTRGSRLQLASGSCIVIIVQVRVAITPSHPHLPHAVFAVPRLCSHDHSEAIQAGLPGPKYCAENRDAGHPHALPVGHL